MIIQSKTCEREGEKMACATAVVAFASRRVMTVVSYVYVLGNYSAVNYLLFNVNFIPFET